ncbi:hypothetical protein HMPREF9005_0245 [Actinomyces sp. oral taxon 178 str. F0338]|nr:hypothetical protein HMPREF9005_0245 [Actinomyces sp. oral taxon 178 str. F0338]
MQQGVNKKLCETTTAQVLVLPLRQPTQDFVDLILVLVRSE